MRLWLATALFVCGLGAQQASDEAVWEEFVRWSAELKPVPPGERVNGGALYTKSLIDRGIPPQEAKRRLERIDVLRRASTERERVYWDAAFKLGGGPSDPLRLLQEAVRKMKPGKALDSGMGRGRNAIWLASLGWDVTGYDMSPDALKVAQSYAEKAGAKIKTIEATHDKFDFGDNQWDLIVASYNYMDPKDPKWPEVFWRALRPDGLAVWQGFRGDTDAVLANWKRFRLVRFEDLDAGVIDDDWAPSRTNRTYRLVVQKKEKVE